MKEKLNNPAFLRRLGLSVAAISGVVLLIGLIGTVFDGDGESVATGAFTSDSSPATTPTTSPSTTAPSIATGPVATTTPTTTTTTTPAPTTTVDAVAVQLALAQALEGTYRGRWDNVTFGTTGSIEATITVDVVTMTVTITSDLGGNVFGGPDPGPQTVTLDLSAGLNSALASPLLGDVSVSVDALGNLEIVGSNVPAPGIAAITISGRFDPAAPQFDYVIEFDDESMAEGVVTVTRVAESTAEDRAAVDAFLADLAVALSDGDGDFLYSRLHPTVLGLYGESQCTAYTGSRLAPGFQLEVRAATGPAPWTWERDGRFTDVEEVFTVDVIRTLGDDVAEQELHVAYVDGEIRWFTDCGDPVATG